MPEIARNIVMVAREDHQPDQEHPLAAEQIAGTTAEKQEAAEHQRVGIHEPLQAPLRQMEILLDRWERDVTIVASRMTMDCATQIRTRTTHGLVVRLRIGDRLAFIWTHQSA
jgi:hypothetical protein